MIARPPVTRTLPFSTPLWILALLLWGAGGAGAQELTGVALGPDGEPLTDHVVVLHRVGGGGGAFVATDTTGARGEFSFPLPAEDPALYFAALRYDGRMYIGPAAEGGGEPVAGYVLSVDPGSEAGAVASALSSQSARPTPARASAQVGAPASSDAGAFLLVGLLALTAAGIFIVAAPRYRRQRTRDALIELARIENALAAPDVQERARLEADRDRHREWLAPRD